MTPRNVPSWIKPMRRGDREIVDSKRQWDILRRAELCHVAFCAEDWPYVVPMNFGCLNGCLYFHSALEGVKFDLLRANANVCFEVEANVEVLAGEKACQWTARYQSVIGWGRMSRVEDPEERRRGMEAILTQYAQYAKHTICIPSRIPENTAVLRIDVELMTGKESTGI